MSPEVITHRPYTFASDMWALGCVLYEMVARRPAFDARGLPQVGVGYCVGFTDHSLTHLLLTRPVAFTAESFTHLLPT